VGAELLALTLLRAGAAAFLGILLVLTLRLPVRALFGPELGYRLWSIVPGAALVSLFPSLAAFRLAWAPQLGAASTGQALPLLQASSALARIAPVLLLVWGLGAAAVALLVLSAEMLFRLRARQGLEGPAMVGLAAPRLVTPRDYLQRFTPAERDLIRRHERAHVRAGHPLANALGAALQALLWFNPLMPLAVSLARIDQELACDAMALEFRPFERRAYAEVLLKAAAGPRCGPLACALATREGRVLEGRIRWLMRRETGVARHLAGVVAVGVAASALAAALWAFAPDENLGGAFWTTGAPKGVTMAFKVRAPARR
jgi:beta-lactamase regulating signal transducer with metallopeptidase domain